jgi:hypothetical protein
VLAGGTATHRFKSKYDDIQRAKTSGRKVHYKKLEGKKNTEKFEGRIFSTVLGKSH